MNRKDIRHYVLNVWSALRRKRLPYCQADNDNPGGHPDMRPCPHRATSTVAHRANPATWLVLDVCDGHARELADQAKRPST